MYRIVISPTTGTWVIQLQVFGFFWKQIGTEEFPCYSAAREACDELGLDNVYEDYSKSYKNYILSGAR